MANKAKKHLKFLTFMLMLTMISGVIVIYVSGRYNPSSEDKTAQFSSRKKKDLTIRGFRFSGYHEGKKAITIKAAKFSVEKKKMGIFKFAPLRTAWFRGAEIDFHINNDSPAQGSQDKKGITIKGLFSKETILASLLKGASSVIFEPVKINFCSNDAPLTQIHAKRATLDLLKRRIALDGKIVATAAVNQLTTDRLMIYPEKGIIEVNHKFIMKTDSEEIKGENLITNLFLEKLDGQQNF